MLNRGFTIVELMVVIVIIGILTGIGVVAANELQKDTRDNKRQSDLAIMSNELDKFFEKYGEYPAGCVSNCTHAAFANNQSSGGALITSTAGFGAIREKLPGLNKNLGDPKAINSSTPFNVTGSYFYFGGTVNTSTANQSVTNYTQYSDSSPAIRCNFQSFLYPNQSSSYVLGYYSETENQWVIKHGRYGSKMRLITGGDASCKL